MIPTEDNVEENLKAGRSFKSEIFFHNLSVLHSDSKLGVGIVLFSNLSLPPSGDFREAKHLMSKPLASGPLANRVGFVPLYHSFNMIIFSAFCCLAIFTEALFVS